MDSDAKVVIDIPAPTDGSLPPVRALQVGALPCVACGIAVEAAPATTKIVVNEYRHRDNVLRDQHVQPATTCSRCADTEHQAEALLQIHPAMWRVYGGLAADRVAGVLHAFDMLDVHMPEDSSTVDLMRMVEYVPEATALPFRSVARSDTCASTRWSHVDPELRRRVREGVARWLKESMEHPVPVGPPADSERRGCLFCGVGTVMATPSRSHRVWRPLRATPRTLGDRGFAADIAGDVCPPCARAIDLELGAVGVTAMRRAILAHIGWRPRSIGAATTELKLLGWGALPDGTPPNEQPWGHVDLAALRADLDAVK